MILDHTVGAGGLHGSQAARTDVIATFLKPLGRVRVKSRVI